MARKKLYLNALSVSSIQKLKKSLLDYQDSMEDKLVLFCQRLSEVGIEIAQANYNGTIKALNDWWGGMSAKQDIPKLQGANATGLYQAVTGVAKAQGERWGKY